VFAFALISPTLQKVTTQVYASNEFLITDTNADAAGIDNNALRNSVQAGLQNQVDNTDLNISALSFLAQYAWAIIAGMIILIIIVATRTTVEVNRGIG